MSYLNKQRLLALALVSAFCGSGTALAQQDGARTDVSTKANLNTAVQDARAARTDAEMAQQAAEQAEAAKRSGAVTAEGAAQAEYSAWQADQASKQAQAAAAQASNAANDAGAARSAVVGGTAVPRQAGAESQQAASSASTAGTEARAAAAEAAIAASEAQRAVTAPPSPPPPPQVVPAGPVEPEVTITSSHPDSVVGDYRVDMAALDGNGDGALSRSEARPNATLTAEFDAVDNDHDGRLTADELKGWMR